MCRADSFTTDACDVVLSIGADGRSRDAVVFTHSRPTESSREPNAPRRGRRRQMPPAGAAGGMGVGGRSPPAHLQTIDVHRTTRALSACCVCAGAVRVCVSASTGMLSELWLCCVAVSLCFELRVSGYD